MQWNRMAHAMVGAAALAALLSLGSARAQSLVAPGTWTFDADTLLLKLHTSGGTGDSNVFDYEGGSRLALTYLGESGVGVRTTWFQWDHAREDSVVGTIVAALCCFTPFLVVLLGAVGLSALLGWLDYVLLPALAFFLVITGYALWKRTTLRSSSDRP